MKNEIVQIGKEGVSNVEEEWTVVQSVYATEDKANKAADIISITEGRLSSIPKGPQYEIETKVEACEQGWRVSWRKVFTGIASGCGSGCSSCSSESPTDTESKSEPQKQELGKLIQFPKRDDKKGG